MITRPQTVVVVAVLLTIGTSACIGYDRWGAAGTRELARQITPGMEIDEVLTVCERVVLDVSTRARGILFDTRPLDCGFWFRGCEPPSVWFGVSKRQGHDYPERFVITERQEDGGRVVRSVHQIIDRSELLVELRSERLQRCRHMGVGIGGSDLPLTRDEEGRIIDIGEPYLLD